MIPFPAQGHVKPMMALSHRLIEFGINITFVNTEFIQARVMAASREDDHDHGQINFVAIPDGLPIDDDRNDLGRQCDSILSVMPACLEELIGKINQSGDDEITYVIADESMAWALEVAEKMRIRQAAFFPAAAALLAAIMNIPDLIEAGTIDANGFPTKEEKKIHPSPTMNTSLFAWLFIGDKATQQTMFKYIHNCSQSLRVAHHIICNSFDDIERPTFDLSPQILPIGPLHGRSDGNFWPQDSSCLTWLDQQPTSSVIYIAFGSFTVFNPHQFQELAHGLELCGRPFLWVVRSDPTDGSTPPYPDGFVERVADRGLVVGWSPQQNVLAHPSVACFITHCGWNSTMEGLVNGVPMLCWPYFADQFLNQVYISDVWRVGLRMDPDGDGIVSRGEIKKKVEDLLGDGGVKARALEIKEMAQKSISEDGTSSKVFNDFVQVIKG
ncbi:hypothetical protein MRB53_005598 [Persea americana]|uniref:Uncharacterized protein n=1 Tax=Persea americana TaxID=3435 RepID=A0ACC2MEI9_PERAE|nr:hypothetical protein MRB53_005598 [Persea americana]